VIHRAVWLCFRFPLNFRDLEEMLAERGTDASYETIRRSPYRPAALESTASQGLTEDRTRSRASRVGNFLHFGRQPQKSSGAVELQIWSTGEAAFLVEMVIDGSVNGYEFLQTSHTPETQHRPLSPSKRQM